VSSIPVFTTYRGESRRLETYGSSWVDDAVGRDARVVYLNTANFEPETLQGRVVETFEPVWETEVWNRSFAGVVSLGVQEPAPLPQRSTTLDWATGRIVELGARYVLARARFRVSGTLLARRGELELVRTSGPVRLASAVEGVDADGSSDGHGALSGWRPARSVRVSVSAGPGVVLVGKLAPRVGGGAQIARRTTKVAFGAGGVAVTVTPPRPPYRIEVFFTGRSVRVGFRIA
jgi:hypothetical protein